MSTHRFNVFGSLFDIERHDVEWRSYAVGADGKRSPAGFVVPGFVEEEELEQFLFDLFHENAIGSKKEIFRVERGGRPQSPGVRVALETPDQPEVIALIAELDTYQDTLYPAEARYALDIASLVKPNVLFAVARAADGTAIGCGAIVLREAHGEIKRMYVRPAARGQGVAQYICRTLESAAYAKGCRTLMLETGPYQPEALAFYANQGFVRCGPFGDYPEHPLSVFMSKHLSPNPSMPPMAALDRGR